jgi:hypothetical protein
MLPRDHAPQRVDGRTQNLPVEAMLKSLCSSLGVARSDRENQKQQQHQQKTKNVYAPAGRVMAQ